MRVEGNSGVQRVGERCGRCGEINSSRGCGEGHAWEGMEADDLLCSRNARPPKALARANGTSRRAGGRAGEKVARSGDQSAPIPEEITSKLGGMGRK